MKVPRATYGARGVSEQRDGADGGRQTRTVGGAGDNGTVSTGATDDHDDSLVTDVVYHDYRCHECWWML